MYVWLCMHGYVCMIMYVWLCMYDCVCMIMYVWLCVYDYVCMIMYVYMHVKGKNISPSLISHETMNKAISRLLEGPSHIKKWDTANAQNQYNVVPPSSQFVCKAVLSTTNHGDILVQSQLAQLALEHHPHCPWQRGFNLRCPRIFAVTLHQQMQQKISQSLMAR